MESSIEEWNRLFAIPGIAQVVAGDGGLAMIAMTTPLARASIYLHGAQVTSWQPGGAEEVLFLSARSRWEEGRAIRGGIPICFPWFRGKADDAQAPAHGVVRTKVWRLDGLTYEGGAVRVVLSTASDAATMKWWPHAFRLEQRITVGDALTLELTATNTGEELLRYEEALHTYFRVGDAAGVRVSGLDGSSFLDNTEGNRKKTQHGDVTLGRQTDSAYLNTGETLELMDPALGRVLRTAKGDSKTTVVWNPWKEGAAALVDLGDEEWRQMVCVEASNILEYAVALAPGECHTLRATLETRSEVSQPDPAARNVI